MLAFNNFFFSVFHGCTQEVKIPGKKMFGFTSETRLFVSSVEEGSTAADLLAPGDEITQVCVCVITECCMCDMVLCNYCAHAVAGTVVCQIFQVSLTFTLSLSLSLSR